MQTLAVPINSSPRPLQKQGGGVVSVILSDGSSHSIQGNTILFSCAGNYSYEDIKIESGYLSPFMGIYDITTNMLEGIGTGYQGEGDSSAIGHAIANNIYLPYRKSNGSIVINITLIISNGVVTSYADQMHFTYIILA